MLLLLAFMALPARSAIPPVSHARSGTITANLDLSEWGPFKKLILDIRTGEYVVTAHPIRNPLTKQAAPEAERGKLTQAELAKVQATYRSALAEGLIDLPCDRDPQRNRLLTGNTGAPRLTLTVNGRSYQGAFSRQCWTSAARALDIQLNDSFAPVIGRMNTRARANAALHLR